MRFRVSSSTILKIKSRVSIIGIFVKREMTTKLTMMSLGSRWRVCVFLNKVGRIFNEGFSVTNIGLNFIS